MKNILIVEDSKAINNLLNDELKKLGYMCHQAFDLKKAEVFLSKLQYDLIILDLHLPDGDGYDLISKIHNLSDSKVVILTGNKEQQRREELFDHGILDYIIKDKNLSYSIREIVRILDNLEKENHDKILVIDDSDFICRQIKMILEPRNYSITIAKTVKEGFKALENGNFDLITLDMELPDSHGLDFLDKIREKPIYNDLPILIISGSTDSDIIRKVYKKGGNEFIRKPFIVEEFALKVDLWVDYRKKMLETISQKDLLLSQQSKMATLGEMLENIIHQATQPLSVITTAATGMTLEQKLEMLTPEKLINNLHTITEAAIHLSDTMKSFKDFYKADKVLKVFDLNELLEKAFRLTSTKYKNRNIELVKDLIDIKLKAYDIELLQVFINILNNARDALENIESKRVVFVTSKVLNNSILEISFKDNAGGIPKNILDKVFISHFTTKDEDKGTGIGLYMSQEIMQKHHNGNIKVNNQTYLYEGVEYKGANFVVQIPLLESLN